MNDSATVSFDPFVRLALLALLALACWSILQPFIPAILFALAISVSSWPAYRWLLRRLGNRRNIASLTACVIVVLAVVLPTVAVVLSLGDAVAWLADLIVRGRSGGPFEAPRWLSDLPLVGAALSNWLRDLTSEHDRMMQALADLAEPARKAALAGGRVVGRGIAQSLLAVVLLFFMYRDGESLAGWLTALARRLGGKEALALLETAQRTIGGVMFSVIGTALAQAMVAALGFAIAGVPNPMLLAAVTFLLSMAPIGPPLVWGGAALWLLREDHPGWAAFMVLYGFFGISSVDNVVKPLLISRSSHLPFALTFLGVIGGVLAFGVAGVFVGPTALALAISLGRQKLFTERLDHKTDRTPD